MTTTTTSNTVGQDIAKIFLQEGLNNIYYLIVESSNGKVYLVPSTESAEIFIKNIKDKKVSDEELEALPNFILEDGKCIHGIIKETVVLNFRTCRINNLAHQKKLDDDMKFVQDYFANGSDSDISDLEDDE